MSIEAPLNKYKKNSLIIYIVVCLAAAVWFGYDGFFNEEFRNKNTKDGVPNSTLVFNQKSPPYLFGASLLLGVYLYVIRNKKIIADENELIVSAKEKISYGSIEKIDKTHFKSKGYFVITYKNEGGGEVERKLNAKTYDNLALVLDHLVAKIS